MPTGYTAAIKDGISFEKFVWNCARGMGALVMMRDDPINAPIPDAFDPSNQHAERAEESRAELTRLQAMTAHQVKTAADAAYREAMERYAQRIAKATELRNKYNAMLAKVVKWTPPTPDHEGLKDFMAEQIRQSIDFDCNTSFDKPPTKPDAQAWHAEAVRRAAANVARYEEEHRKEIERTNGRNAWLKALRDSVPPAP